MLLMIDRLIDWLVDRSIQETTILENHFVRPGDRLVLYSLVKVLKLAVSVGGRRFFVPLDHPSQFHLLSDTSSTPCRLEQLVSASTTFPLLFQLGDGGSYVNCSETLLPKETPLKAEVSRTFPVADL